MRVAYFYFMKSEPELVRTVALRHATYWRELALPAYRGGPFADRSGGLILFDSNSAHEAEDVVARDPFVLEQLLERHWMKEWNAEPQGQTTLG